jgi:shikimate dehydrogenase
MAEPLNFLSLLTGCFAMPAAENPTVAMIEAAYRHHGLDARYINCEVAPADLGNAVRGARAMGWAGFNCSIPHKIAVIGHLDGLAESADLIGAVLVREVLGADIRPITCFGPLQTSMTHGRKAR